MDEDYCIRHAVKSNTPNDEVEDFYEWETHIFFDDSITKIEGTTKTELNNFAAGLIDTVDDYGKEWYQRIGVEFEKPTKMLTPYGGRVQWKLPGESLLTVHLKDKTKIRNKKRYLYFKLTFILVFIFLQMVTNYVYVLFSWL